MQDIDKVVKLLKYFLPDILKIREIPIGNINRTFLVKTTKRMVVAQLINKKIFNIEALSHNLQEFYKIVKKSELLSSRVPSFIFINGQLISCDKDGNYWKFTEFVPRGLVRQFPQNARDAYLAAKTLSTFHKEIRQANPRKFRIVIKNFFNPVARLKALRSATKNGNQDRLKQTLDLRKKLEMFTIKIEKYLFAVKHVQKWVFHQDTKFENFIITRDQAYLIDFDTLQPGSLILEIGDFIRTVCFTSKEDSVDNLEPNHQNLGSALEGLREHMDYPTTFQVNQKLLALAPSIVSYILSIRFLTDYLLGDRYFNISYPEQNFYRALSQYTRACLLFKIRNSIRL